MRKRFPLKVSISGVRGIVGESLTPQITARFVSAFGTYLGQGQVLVGQDTRPSGIMLKKAVLSALLSTGCQPVELGVLPIPTILFLTMEKKARGAVVITASHNPAEWNGLKFIGPEGLYLKSSQFEEFLLWQYAQRIKHRIKGGYIMSLGGEVDIACRIAQIQVSCQNNPVDPVILSKIQ